MPPGCPEVLVQEIRKLSKSRRDFQVEVAGGKVFLGVDDAPALSDLASTTRRAAGLVSKQPLSNPWFIMLTVGLLGATWLVRRRWGRR